MITFIIVTLVLLFLIPLMINVIGEFISAIPDMISALIGAFLICVVLPILAVSLLLAGWWFLKTCL